MSTYILDHFLTTNTKIFNSVNSDILPKFDSNIVNLLESNKKERKLKTTGSYIGNEKYKNLYIGFESVIRSIAKYISYSRELHKNLKHTLDYYKKSTKAEVKLQTDVDIILENYKKISFDDFLNTYNKTLKNNEGKLNNIQLISIFLGYNNNFLVEFIKTLQKLKNDNVFIDFEYFKNELDDARKLIDNLFQTIDPNGKFSEVVMPNSQLIDIKKGNINQY